MRYFWAVCCVGCLGVSYFVVSCIDSSEDIIFNGSVVSFIKSFRETRMTFPTDHPGKTVTISIKSRPGTVRPRLKSAIELLKRNYSHMSQYERDTYDCKHFALRLYEDLQAANYESRYVVISLLGEREGHALAAVETSDAGTLFVDFTPFILVPNKQRPARSVARVRPGKKYVRIPLESLTAGFRNEDADYEAFAQMLDEAVVRVQKHNLAVDDLDQHKKQIEADIADFQAKTKNGVNPKEYDYFLKEKEKLERSVSEVNQKYDYLILQEQLLKNSSYLDWVGRSWVVNSIRLVPE